VGTRHVFGTHAVDTGGLDMAVRRSAAAGFRAVQIFTAIPKYYGDRSSIRAERVTRLSAALAETGIQPAHVLVHAAYVLNVATADPVKWSRAAAGLAKEMERSTLIGAGAVCFHPGSAGTSDPAEAAQRVATAMTAALRAHPGGTRLLVENTAGAGRTLGRTAAEVADILRQLPRELRSRAGYGLDTCHLYASGYDITASAAAFQRILDEFEDATGERPSFFHLNDSEGALGTNRDRHVLIGEGRIGAQPFAWLLADARSHGVPLILETPQQNYELAADDASADPYDLRMAELLAALAGNG
jgi:deoxyribonuclease IV